MNGLMEKGLSFVPPCDQGFPRPLGDPGYNLLMASVPPLPYHHHFQRHYNSVIMLHRRG